MKERSTIKAQNDLTIKDDELKQELDTIKALMKKQDRSNRLQEYMNQPNVKNFNMMLLDRSFNRLPERDSNDLLPVFTNVEYARNEVIEYLKACNDYNMTPHIGSLCSYLGIRRDELIYYSAHPEICPTAFVLAKAMDYCQYILEENVVNDKLDARTYAFMGANYFHLRNGSTVVEIKPSATSYLENKGLDTNQSLIALREQIANTPKKIIENVDE
jgi:hypothetical protein